MVWIAIVAAVVSMLMLVGVTICFAMDYRWLTHIRTLTALQRAEKRQGWRLLFHLFAIAVNVIGYLSTVLTDYGSVALYGFWLFAGLTAVTAMATGQMWRRRVNRVVAKNF